jgi:hypothetical protein
MHACLSVHRTSYVRITGLQRCGLTDTNSGQQIHIALTVATGHKTVGLEVAVWSVFEALLVQLCENCIVRLLTEGWILFVQLIVRDVSVARYCNCKFLLLGNLAEGINDIDTRIAEVCFTLTLCHKYLQNERLLCCRRQRIGKSFMNLQVLN